MKEVRLCDVRDVPIGKSKVFLVQGKKIALFHRSEGFYALDDHCPHRSGPLSEGLIENGEVSCPWHQWSFRLSDGACINIPGASVPVFAVDVKDDVVFVSI